MNKTYKILFVLIAPIVLIAFACQDEPKPEQNANAKTDIAFPFVDTGKIPNDSMGAMIRYGRNLMLNTAYYIGPDGVNGKYLGNKMNCTNCHQDAGTKPFAFNLMRAHEIYPQYRAREGKVLSLSERVNNCVMRPQNGRPLPLDSREMIAFLSYFKWLNGFIDKKATYKGEKAFALEFPNRAASPALGQVLYGAHCQRCHGEHGEGKMQPDGMTYQYPLLWGDSAYQPGSSMHRVIKQAQWIKVNMPYDSAKYDKPVLSDEEAFDIAAFVNDDRIHKRPDPVSFDYPHPKEKAIDYGRPPFADTFPALAHKFGPYQPIIDYWKANGIKAVY